MVESMKRRPLTRFGGVVMALSTERGVTTQRALAELIDGKVDGDVSQHRLGRWLRGEHNPPWWFCELLVDVLELSEEEMNRLALANTYGQRTPLERTRNGR